MKVDWSKAPDGYYHIIDMDGRNNLMKNLKETKNGTK